MYSCFNHILHGRTEKYGRVLAPETQQIFLSQLLQELVFGRLRCTGNRHFTMVNFEYQSLSISMSAHFMQVHSAIVTCGEKYILSCQASPIDESNIIQQVNHVSIILFNMFIFETTLRDNAVKCGSQSP